MVTLFRVELHSKNVAAVNTTTELTAIICCGQNVFGAIALKEKRMQKIWQEAFEEQMNVMKEKFADMSAETMSGLTESIENETEETTQEGSESTELISGE